MEKFLFGEGRKAYLHLKNGEATLPTGRCEQGRMAQIKCREKKKLNLQKFVDCD